MEAHPIDEQAGQLFHFVVDEGLDNGVLVLEVVVDVADAHARSLGELGHTRAVKSIVTEQLGGRGQYLVAPSTVPISRSSSLGCW